MKICPNCGNRNQAFVQDNGERPSSPYLTLLCIAPVKPEDSPFDFLALAQRPGACGMQWEPNADPRDDYDEEVGR